MLQTNEQIGHVVVVFFDEQFHVKKMKTDYAVIDQIPMSISYDKNEAMSRLLDQDEVKKWSLIELEQCLWAGWIMRAFF